MKVIGKFIKSVMRKNIKFSRGEGNIMAVGKNITWEKGKVIFPIILSSIFENFNYTFL